MSETIITHCLNPIPYKENYQALITQLNAIRCSLNGFGTVKRFNFTNNDIFTGVVTFPTSTPTLSLDISYASNTTDGIITAADYQLLHSLSIPTLNSVLNNGDETLGLDIILTELDRIAVGSNRAGLGKGLFDTSRGGDKGVSLYCAIGIELNWQAGYLRALAEGGDGTPIELYSDSEIIYSSLVSTTPSIGTALVTKDYVDGLITPEYITSVDNTSQINLDVTLGELTATFASNNISQFTNDSGYINLTSLSATSPVLYNDTTGVISIQQATTSQDGYLSSTDWNTFDTKQAALSGTGFVKINGTIISYDNSTYLTTSSASSTYFPLLGGTITGTAGNGFFGAIAQSNKPSTPSSGFRLYANSSNALSWIGQNGYVRTFDGTSNTADRTYTLPNTNTTIAGLAVSQTFTNNNIFNNTVTASSNIARGVNITGSYTNATTSDVLVALDIQPTFINTFTRYKNLGLRIGTSYNSYDTFANALNLLAEINGNVGINGTLNVGGDSSIINLWSSGAIVNGMRIGANYASPGFQHLFLGVGGGNKQMVIIQSNGNVIIQNGGTFTDAGYKLDVTGTGRYTSDVTMRHLIGGSSTPTIAAGVGAGTSPTVSLSGTDMGGAITITTGTSPTAASIIATITFNATYSATPKTIIIKAANLNSYNNGVDLVYIDLDSSDITASIFRLRGTLAASTTYKFFYQIIQ